MVELEAIRNVAPLHADSISSAAYDHSSLDLHITEEAYELLEGSVKPGGEKYLLSLKSDKLVKELAPESGEFRLLARRTYLFRLKEELHATDMKEAELHAQATAPSTIGRMDVLVRLVVDGASEYDGFSPDDMEKSTGDLFAEVTPMTFNVRVRPGDRLTQLRFFYGHPEESEVKGKRLYKTVLLGQAGIHDNFLRVELEPAIVGGLPVSAFYAEYESKKDEYLPLWKPEAPERERTELKAYVG